MFLVVGTVNNANLNQSLRVVPTVMLMHWVLKFLSQITFSFRTFQNGL